MRVSRRVLWRILLVMGIAVGLRVELSLLIRNHGDEERRLLGWERRSLEPSRQSIRVIDHTTTNHWNMTHQQDSFALSSQRPHRKPQQLQKLSINQVVFLHIGKAAGGSFNHRTRAQLRLFIEQCHPAPCHNLLRRPNNDNNNKRHILVTLRDPVDRFLSAFYWRIYMLCHPNPVEQQQQHGPPLGCKVRPAEARILFYTYQQNASKLAEDLCSPLQPVRTKARASLRKIEHAKWSIQNWLDFDWKSQADHIFPLVVEHGIIADSYSDQTDAALHWLRNRTHFESQSALEERYRQFQQQSFQKEDTEYSHSSRALKQELSAEAVQCLVHLYRQDYEILHEIRTLACKTDVCRQGIDSILSRRGPLLLNHPMGV